MGELFPALSIAREWLSNAAFRPMHARIVAAPITAILKRLLTLPPEVRLLKTLFNPQQIGEELQRYCKLPNFGAKLV